MNAKEGATVTTLHPKIIHMDEAMERTGMARSTLYNWRYLGIIPCRSMRGKVVFYWPDDFQSLVSAGVSDRGRKSGELE